MLAKKYLPLIESFNNVIEKLKRFPNDTIIVEIIINIWIGNDKNDSPDKLLVNRQIFNC